MHYFNITASWDICSYTSLQAPHNRHIYHILLQMCFSLFILLICTTDYHFKLSSNTQINCRRLKKVLNVLLKSSILFIWSHSNKVNTLKPLGFMCHTSMNVLCNSNKTSMDWLVFTPYQQLLSYKTAANFDSVKIQRLHKYATMTSPWYNHYLIEIWLINTGFLRNIQRL